MTTRGQINSNFYQIVNVDIDGNPTSVKTSLIQPAGSNREVQFNDGNTLASNSTFTFNKTTGVLTVPTIAGNVTGNVTNALHANVADVANSVAGANVTGTVALATHANIADVANSVAGANVTGSVTNALHANIADVANSVAGANVTGVVANANYASYSSNANSVNAAIANVIITGGTANYLLKTDGAGNLSWTAPPSATAISNGTSNVSVPVSSGNVTFGVGGVSNIVVVTTTGLTTTGDVTANAFYGNLIGNIVGNIVVPGVNTSVIFNTDGNADGTTTFLFNKATDVLSVPTANITTLNASGNVTSAYFIGNGSQLSSLTGANVTGTVANATHAVTSNTVTDGAQPNITSVGTLVSLDVTGNVSANAYQLTTSPGTLSAATGQMVWNHADGTVDIGLGYSNVVLQVGQETHYVVRNATGSTILNGTSVYCSGVTAGSGRMEATPFTADGTISPVQYLGLATMNISNGVNGVVTYFGYVRGLDTRGTANTAISVGDENWAEGDKLYAHPTAAGKLTKVEPTAPNDKICVCVVITRNQTSGTLFVRPTTNLNVSDHSDVQITTPTTGQALVYNGSNVWVNGNPEQANIANTANSVAVANVSGIGNIATVNLDGNVSNILSGTGTWISLPASTPGGANTEIQYNNNGVFAGISTVTYNGTNISLGSVTTVKITGGTSSQVLSTDGTGNLSWVAQSGGGGGSSGFDQTFLLMGA